MPDSEIQFFTSTPAAWEVMLRDIYSAQKTIDIEQYIFSHDTIGERFIDALFQKAKQGVKIRLFVDAVGSNDFYRSDVPAEMRNAGIQIKIFNPISPWRITNFTANFFRDHRKIMIIDGTIGHIGGVGIRADMETWRDSHVRLTTPIVLDLMQSFEAIWKGISKWTFLKLRRVEPQILRHFDLLTNAPLWGSRRMYRALLEEVRNAKKYIYLATPYFIPDQTFFRALRLAAHRGVDVRLIVPAIGDHVFVDYAKESYYTLALKSGIRIYHYQKSMMHAKYAVIDDDWATMGSFNLDNLSFFFNHEANIASTEKFFSEEIKKHFYDDLRNCIELHYDIWVKRAFFRKIVEFLTWPFHRIM